MTNKIICPHCKSDKGFYTRERITGTAQKYYNSSGDLEEEQGVMTACRITGEQKPIVSSAINRWGKQRIWHPEIMRKTHGGGSGMNQYRVYDKRTDETLFESKDKVDVIFSYKAIMTRVTMIGNIFS